MIKTGQVWAMPRKYIKHGAEGVEGVRVCHAQRYGGGGGTAWKVEFVKRPQSFWWVDEGEFREMTLIEDVP